MTDAPTPDAAAASPGPQARSTPPTDQELLTTLYDLGRQVSAVLDLDELMRKVPAMIARLVDFQAFAAYLLDERRGELRIAHAVGYPAEIVETLRLKVGQGLVGAAVAEGRALVVGDVLGDPRYVETVPGTRSALVVPLRRKGKIVGALNLQSRTPWQFTPTDEAVLRQFAAAVAIAIENARLFEKEKQYAETLETLAHIGREVASILDLDELLTAIAQHVRCVINYRTFGILLLNEETKELEMKLAVKYGEHASPPTVKLGEGLCGYAALHKEPVLVPDVSKDPRYIKFVEDARSELVIPLLVKDRCIGVFDLESPELEAFTKEHEEILTLLASQAAVAIENARLYETVRANEIRMENELRFAQRVQVALLPSGLPKRMKGVDVAARFAPARELGGDLFDFLSPEPNNLVVAVGDVSGKGVPAALYSAFAGELIRSRTFRRRFTPEAASPAGVLASINTILNERGLSEYYCTLCYAQFDLKRRTAVFANSGLPYPLRCVGGASETIELAGVPLGSFAGSAYDELRFDLHGGDLFVFCTDGVTEAEDADGRDFGLERLIDTVRRAQGGTAQTVVDAVFSAVEAFRGDAPPNDDMTAVAVRFMF